MLAGNRPPDASEKDSGAGFSGRNDFDPGVEAQLPEKVLTICPRKTECANIRNAEPRHNGRNDRGIVVIEFALHESVLGPIHQLRLRNLMMQIGGDPVCYGSFCDPHDVYLIMEQFPIPQHLSEGACAMT